ncbi:MAG: flippase-like domain-containing protein [Deltaproteobacteria bacterium]|nr:flippase-like domain-containing protein [Deltaproteobacteria bacterium]
MSKQKIGVFVGVAVNCLILLFLTHQIQWQDLSAKINDIRWLRLPLLAVLFMFGNWLRAYRWQYFLEQNQRPQLSVLFQATMVGFTATFLLPLRAGEFVRAFFLSKITTVTFSRSFASIIAERVFDVLALLMLLYIGLSLTPQAELFPGYVNTGVKALGLIAFAFGLAMFLAIFIPKKLFRFTYIVIAPLLKRKHSTLFKKLIRMAHEFIHGLAAIKDFKTLLIISVLSIILWLSAAAFYQASLWAMGIESNLVMGIIILVMIALLVAAPSAPGFIGTYQAGCVIAIHNMYLLSKEFALAYSILTHALQALLVVSIGLVILLRRGIRLLDLTPK